MNRVYKKLFQLSSWNIAASGLNFLSTIAIAKFLGIDLLGEWAYINATIGLMGLCLIILPTNYSLFKYQDDHSYRYIFSSFFILVLGFILLFSFVISFFIDLSYGVIVIFSFSLLYQNYFDTTFQALNKLTSYYFLLFNLAVSKIFAIGLLIVCFEAINLYELVLSISLFQSIILIFYLQPFFSDFKKGFFHFYELIMMIKKEKNLFSKYYISSILKTLNSNIIILLFGSYVTKEVLGIYNLLFKVHAFIIGLTRTIETLLINRISAKKYSVAIRKNIISLGIVMQAIHIVVGVIYLFLSVGEMYVYYILVFSFFLYPYLYFVEARAFFLGKYNLNVINYSGMLFLAVVLIMFILTSQNLVVPTLLFMVFTYLVAVFVQEIVLIYFFRIHKNPAMVDTIDF